MMLRSQLRITTLTSLNAFSEILIDLSPILKEKIRALSYEDRAELKEKFLEGNAWVTEYVPPATACLACSTAGSIFILPKIVFAPMFW
jgi:hypothetical protein